MTASRLSSYAVGMTAGRLSSYAVGMTAGRSMGGSRWV